ncbi:DUF6371 domain-containing protein [Polaribacter glomeratus]|uniref:DUF6371 domain-containing protein n=1 Tax=Polaribacter glomeratus TaxID=102 RepID=A0A2S7WYY1_9FLAO|nr:DUF6371 domain-containing protein [Polaribacter glomeratus]PQJ82790.1 hypothetical protein BTO16_09455 [Polaribacter glomeratus]TXD65331.1 hypothetical protein ESX12_10935 [Polaribacter glomeratus]
MKIKLKKVELKLKFKNRRNFKILTPCCAKSNKDGKFVNYVGLRDVFGYCHSCGQTTLPPTQYVDENNGKYEWDSIQSKFVSSVLGLSYSNGGQSADKHGIHCDTSAKNEDIAMKYVENKVVDAYMRMQPENNLLTYICKTYGEKDKEYVKQLYKLGTSKDRGAVFWSINKKNKVQKGKVSYYDKNGKRTDNFKVPYLKKDGYYSCLFGEHLLGLPEYKSKPIILVESEKTAVISSIILPKYTWLSYAGINGLTNLKLEALRGLSIIVVPDISSNAVSIMQKKEKYFLELDINAKIWDMTNGKTDEELKQEGLYNCDLEDFFRRFIQ